MTPPQLSEDLLSAYVDDELDADTRAALDARLATSPEWRAVLDEVRTVRTAVRALPRVDLTPDAWASLLEAVAGDPAPSQVDSPVPPLLRLRRAAASRPGRWIGAAAAAAAVVVAALVLPTQARISPKVATFSNEQSARASVVGDPVSALAGVGLMHGLGR